MSTKSKKIDEVLAEEGAAAENYEIPGALPETVKVSRPNLGRPTVVSVRLSADEYARLQRAAEKANLPVSTLIRIWTLDRVRVEAEGGAASLAQRLARLERAVFPRSA
ncbi:MAG: CopG family transcriptional regulator [Candidatus Dormiibacterota bacterium]